ncbi:hypothetical protein JCM10213_007154 [Rhodosporidiobolus nylandii]
MSAPGPPGCIVCGAQTTQRCSSCAHVGLEVRFCKPEHQKLIWFAHKRVCGKNAKPYRFPLLTAEEARVAKEVAFTVPLLYTANETLAGYYKKVLGCSTEGVALVIDSISEPGSGGYTPVNEARLICVARVAIFYHQTEKGAALERVHGIGSPVAGADNLEPFLWDTVIFSHLTHVREDEAGVPVDPFPLAEDWYCLLHQHFLAVFTLRYLHRKLRLTDKPKADRELWPLVDGSRKELVGFIWRAQFTTPGLLTAIMKTWNFWISPRKAEDDDSFAADL